MKDKPLLVLSSIRNALAAIRSPAIDPQVDATLNQIEIRLNGKDPDKVQIRAAVQQLHSLVAGLKKGSILSGVLNDFIYHSTLLLLVAEGPIVPPSYPFPDIPSPESEILRRLEDLQNRL